MASQLEQVRRAVAASTLGSPCLRECAEALRTEGLEEIGAGRMTAREALATFVIREQTSRAAGIDTCGMDETIEALRGVADEDELELFHFRLDRRAFTIVTRRDLGLLGCIRVVTRSRATPSRRGEVTERFRVQEGTHHHVDAPLAGFADDIEQGGRYAFMVREIVPNALWHWLLIPVPPDSGTSAVSIFDHTNAPPDRWLSVIEDRRDGASVFSVEDCRRVSRPARAMTYVRVVWKHRRADDGPVLLFCELDEERNEIRKVEIHTDGRIGYADDAEASLGTALGDTHGHVVPDEIDWKTFEEAWALRRTRVDPKRMRGSFGSRLTFPKRRADDSFDLIVRIAGLSGGFDLEAWLAAWTASNTTWVREWHGGGTIEVETLRLSEELAEGPSARTMADGSVAIVFRVLPGSNWWKDWYVKLVTELKAPNPGLVVERPESSID